MCGKFKTTVALTSISDVDSIIPESNDYVLPYFTIIMSVKLYAVVPSIEKGFELRFVK